MKWLPLLGLLLIQDPVIDSLLNDLSNPANEVRVKAIESLVRLGELAEPKVKAHKRKAEGDVRIHCENVLRRIEGNRRRPAFIPPVKWVTLEAKDEALMTVLDRFEAQAGWRPRKEWDFNELPVTVKIKEAPALEALDSICRSIGADFELGPDIQPSLHAEPTLNAVPHIKLVKAGKARAPQAVVGHYRILPTHLTLTRSNQFRGESAGCQLGIKVQWTPEFRPDEILFRPTSVVDDKGRSLYDPKSYMIFVYQAERRERDRSRDGHFPDPNWSGWNLLHPERDAKSVASFKGRIWVRLLTDKKYIEFLEPEKNVGQGLEYDGMTVRLKEYRKEPRKLVVVLEVYGGKRNYSPLIVGAGTVMFKDIELETEPPDTLLNRSEAREQYGERIAGVAQMIDSFRLEYNNPELNVKAIKILVDATLVEDCADFELKDIPLPK